MTKLLFAGLVIVLLIARVDPAGALEQPIDQPYYVVLEGDSLWDIAARFGVRNES